MLYPVIQLPLAEFADLRHFCVHGQAYVAVLSNVIKNIPYAESIGLLVSQGRWVWGEQQVQASQVLEKEPSQQVCWFQVCSELQLWQWIFLTLANKSLWNSSQLFTTNQCSNENSGDIKSYEFLLTPPSSHHIMNMGGFQLSYPCDHTQ